MSGSPLQLLIAFSLLACDIVTLKPLLSLEKIILGYCNLMYLQIAMCVCSSVAIYKKTDGIGSNLNLYHRQILLYFMYMQNQIQIWWYSLFSSNPKNFQLLRFHHFLLNHHLNHLMVGLGLRWELELGLGLVWELGCYPYPSSCL